jgi:uncharacterized protein YozE (UPF0346 family)
VVQAGDAMTPTRSFNEWVMQARVTNDPAGDLIDDMRADQKLPSIFHSIGELRRYLILKNACRGALVAVPVVWRRYRHWLDRCRVGEAQR